MGHDHVRGTVANYSTVKSLVRGVATLAMGSTSTRTRPVSHIGRLLRGDGVRSGTPQPCFYPWEGEVSTFGVSGDVEFFLSGGNVSLPQAGGTLGRSRALPRIVRDPTAVSLRRARVESWHWWPQHTCTFLILSPQVFFLLF